jgi:zinc protease
LKASNRTIGEFIPTLSPERTEIPPPPNVAALLEGYTGDKAMAQGEAFDPSPANIESRTQRTSAGGLKLALLPKRTRGGKVVVSLTLHYGTLESLTNQAAVEDMAIDMLRRGSKKHTRQQFQDELDKLKARLSISGGGGNLHAGIETVRESLPQALALLGEALREPTFPEDQFKQLMQENLAAIEQQRTDPSSMAGTEYARHLNPYPKGDPRYTMTPEEAIAVYKEATLTQVSELYHRLLGASHGEISIVGDFDSKQVTAQVQELFADWKSAEPYVRIPRPYQEVAPQSKTLEAKDKANALFLCGQNLKLRDDDPDYPALALGNYMIGGGFLNSRLAVRVRQKEGFSYGIGSHLSAPALDDGGAFQVNAIHAPQATQKLEAAVREELQRALADGFTEQELREARSGWLQGRQVSRAQDGALASHLTHWLYLGRTLQWDADYEKKVASLTPQQIVEALRRHIDPAKFTVVRAGEFKAGAHAEK